MLKISFYGKRTESGKSIDNRLIYSAYLEPAHTNVSSRNIMFLELLFHGAEFFSNRVVVGQIVWNLVKNHFLWNKFTYQLLQQFQIRRA